MDTTFKWPPLESDPEIFTEYAHKIGLNNTYQFNEIFSMDCLPEEGPAYAVVLSRETGPSGKVPRDESKFIESSALSFFMKQSTNLDNACGIIASLHAIGNNRGDDTILNNSILSNFYNSTKDKSPEDKATSLEGANEFKTVHQQYSNQGQSNLCENQDAVKHHFVCFIYHDGNLVELDGCLKGPYIVKEGIKQDQLVQEACNEIKKRLENGNITDKLAIMYLTKS